MKLELTINKVYTDILTAVFQGEPAVKVCFEGRPGEYEFSDLDLEAIEEVKKCFPGIYTELEYFSGFVFCIFSWDDIQFSTDDIIFTSPAVVVDDKD